MQTTTEINTQVRSLHGRTFIYKNKQKTCLNHEIIYGKVHIHFNDETIKKEFFLIPHFVEFLLNNEVVEQNKSISRHEVMANNWIAEMKAAGLNYDQMLEVFKKVRQKLNILRQS